MNQNSNSIKDSTNQNLASVSEMIQSATTKARELTLSIISSDFTFFILRNIIKGSMYFMLASSAGLAAYIMYIKYTLPQQQAKQKLNNIIEAGKSALNNYMIFSNKLFDQVAHGIEIGVKVGLTNIFVAGVFAFLGFNIQSFLNTELDFSYKGFISSVIQTPISEEILFRGVILNVIKMICNLAIPTFKIDIPKEEPAQNNNVQRPAANLNAVDNNVQRPAEKETFTNVDLTQLVSLGSSALLFAQNSNNQLQSIIRGWNYGKLSQEQNGGIASCVANHVTYNLVSFGAAYALKNRLSA